MTLSPGRISPRNMDDRQWAQFVAQSGIQADRTAHAFAPTWAGFSVDPTGSFYYYDFGATVMVWNDSSTAITGTSNGPTMLWADGSLPEGIRPSGLRAGVAAVVDEGRQMVGGYSVTPTGKILFLNGATGVIANKVVLDQLGFDSAGTLKGLPAGWLIQYPK